MLRAARDGGTAIEGYIYIKTESECWSRRENRGEPLAAAERESSPYTRGFVVRELEQERGRASHPLSELSITEEMAFNGDGPHSKRQRLEESGHRVSGPNVHLLSFLTYSVRSDSLSLSLPLPFCRLPRIDNRRAHPEEPLLAEEREKARSRILRFLHSPIPFPSFTHRFLPCIPGALSHSHTPTAFLSTRGKQAKER